MDNMISIQNVSFKYRTGEGMEDVLALDNVSFDVKKGDFVGIIGHNGSGKSTIAKLLNAIYFPTNGDIFISGMNTKDEKNIWEIRQKAGMIFQNPDNQMVATIVEEDVAFGPENLSVPHSDLRGRVDEALKMVGMYEYKDNKPHELSGGQKQRVAIAGLLAMEPECIILDEPTAMLDPKGRVEVLNMIKRLNKEKNTTIVLITHYMEEIVDCDNIFIMNNGKLEYDGKPKDVFKQVEFLRKLRLEPPFATRVSYEMNKAGINIKDDVLTIDELAEEICQLKG